MKNINDVLTPETDSMSASERALFLKDLKQVTEEYFESDDGASLEITRTEEGLLVCVIFTARRIKTVKTPA